MLSVVASISRHQRRAPGRMTMAGMYVFALPEAAR
jgi:hypothetical protein